jgi:hypothetical protein
MKYKCELTQSNMWRQVSKFGITDVLELYTTITHIRKVDKSIKASRRIGPCMNCIYRATIDAQETGYLAR